MKKIKNTIKILSFSAILSILFTVVVYAMTSHNLGSISITSTYNNYFGSYDYTDATAYATYSINRISTGSLSYTRFYTTLERSTAGYWQGLGTKTTSPTAANLSIRVTWQDINAGTFRYHVVGNSGTTYTTLTVGSY